MVEVYRKWETREKLSPATTLAEAWEADYNLSPSLFVEIDDEAHTSFHLPDSRGPGRGAKQSENAADAEPATRS